MPYVHVIIQIKHLFMIYAMNMVFYVIDEVNLETHGTWSELFDKAHILPDDKPEWLDIILDRANSMYERDKTILRLLSGH